MNDQDDARQRDGLARQASEASVTYRHASYEGGQHWFSAEHDGDEVGHALVLEQQGPGGPHVEIKKLRTDPHYRGRGIGSRLMDNVGEHFRGRELRLKPYPVEESGDQDEGDLREFYRNRGFGDYELKEGDPFELYDFMTRRASSRPAAGPADAGSGYLRGEPDSAGSGDVLRLDAMPEKTAGVSLGIGSWLTMRPARPGPGRPAIRRRRVASTASVMRQARPGRPR